MEGTVISCARGHIRVCKILFPGVVISYRTYRSLQKRLYPKSDITLTVCIEGRAAVMRAVNPYPVNYTFDVVQETVCPHAYNIM